MNTCQCAFLKDTNIYVQCLKYLFSFPSYCEENCPVDMIHTFGHILDDFTKLHLGGESSAKIRPNQITEMDKIKIICIFF